MLIYCNRNVSWRWTDSAHFSKTEIPMETWLPSQQLGSSEMHALCARRAPRSDSYLTAGDMQVMGACGRRWGLGGSQVLVAHPGAPQFGGFWLLQFELPWNSRLVTMLSTSRNYFAFEREHFKTTSATSFWCFPGQQKYHNSTLGLFVTRWMLF